MEIESLMELALSHAKSLGASYADIRYESAHSESCGAEDGQPKEASRSFDEGFGIRGLAGGSWGFSSINGGEDTKKDVLFDAVAIAVGNSKATTRGSKKITLEPACYCGKYKTNVKKDPFKVPLEDTMAGCVEATKQMGKVNDVAKAFAGVGYEKVHKVFYSTDGSKIEQDQTYLLASTTAVASANGITEYYSTTEGGQKGYEALTIGYDMQDDAIETAKKAVELVNAKSPKPYDTNVVIDPDGLALIVHEISGHPCEADRILGWEAAWAGTAWWQDMAGQKIGSDYVNIVSDASIPGYLGSYGFDDEGTPAQKITHLKNGVLTGFMHTRQTAAIMGVKPNGAARATAHTFAPIVRMTNTYMEAGDWKKDEIIEDTKDGVYFCGMHTPSIDSRRYNFQISCRIAYEIKDGEIGKPLRGVSIMGTADKFWASVDAAADDVEMRPVANCGKGDPMQTCMVGNGGPHIRAKGKIVGVA